MSLNRLEWRLFILIVCSCHAAIAGDHYQYWPPSRLRQERQAVAEDQRQSYNMWPLHVVVALPLSEGWSYRNPFLLTLAKSQPVLDVAVEDVYWQWRLLPEGALDLSFVDTNLSDALGPQRVIEKHCAGKVDAVMGFAYVYAIAPVARMSYMWGNGVPVFTTSAMVDELGDRTQFPLLTRMMGTYKITARFVLNLMLAFGWSHVRFVFNDHAVETSTRMGRSECYFCLLAVRNIIKQEKISWTHDVFHERSDVPPDYHEILKKASLESNIIILCASPDTVREIMLAAHDLGMATSGEYVFINIDVST
uniref:Receptor ligand binding region domain-containing protein n=1 Tax=Plectus sambesii TaxID=2011161 RepID=A0A914XG69_9BILA